ncbi:MAG: VCBS repeat-containing protein [Crocinitomicaceae bacterium]
MKIILGLILSFLGIYSLAQSEGFKSIPSETTGITFNNSIIETKSLNIMNYDYLYNGGGVGIGDFNKDGFQDIFFSGNQVNDQLYFNKGGFRFEKVSLPSQGQKGWSTGVCVFDVNEDGWDDIYVCRSGADSLKLKNVLYVNQQNGSFKEEASLFGLDLVGHHIQAAPLDIDLDGDLDLYVMGHPGKFQHKVDYIEMAEKVRNGLIESDVLLENVGGKFIDITKESKIVEYGYGLGLAITDLNLDGYPDIIVCNDFDEPDHVFINQQNNTFKDQNLSYFKHTSNYSMGNDVGDINNDGMLDYISVDMAFDSHERSKTNMASMDLQKFNARVQLGWGYQYMHNMLHLNTGLGTFQEIAQISGVAKTDWSWAPLFMDIDQDGYQDLFITNGYKRDTKNNDIKYKLEALKEKKGEVSLEEFLALIPSVKIENYFFGNNQDLTFADKREDWGVDEKLNSNGAAYVDLDNDGDLDLVLNNVDTLASVYENKLKTESQYLVLDFSELPQNVSSGLKIKVETEKGVQIRENYFVRGYQSTVDKRQFFYCPSDDAFVKVSIGKDFEILNPKPNNTYLINASMATPSRIEGPFANSLAYFEEITESSKLEAVYIDNKFNDFEKESLLPHQISTKGPEIVVGDFDKNGFEDFIVSSAVGKIPMVYLQNTQGKFKKMLSRSFYNHHATEDGDMTVLDINGDNNLDLIISSGGYQYESGDTSYQNRLYIGNGLGMFGLVKNALPIEGFNSGKILKNDIDKDGDEDLIVFGAADPLNYPSPGTTKIYLNTKGFFRDATADISPEIENVGMVNDAVLSDFDSDGDLDIVIVGEWMNVTVFQNTNGKYKKFETNLNLPGWWSCIEIADVDGDGDDDYLLGNAGMNNKYRPSVEKPLEVYANDFDDNGTIDIVLAYDKKSGKLPVRGRECSSSQMPFIADKFPTFLEFATSGLEDIYPKEKLDAALHLKATEFRSGVIYNNGEKGFSFEPFSIEGQVSFINDFEFIDINGDGLKDIIAVGNRFNSEVETTRYDAGCGVVYLQKKGGGFEYATPLETKFFAPHNAKSLCTIKLANGKTGILVGNNNQIIQLFQLNY